jgi:hypothetical protein
MLCKGKKSLKKPTLYCLSFDLQILITPLVSSNSSYLYRASELNPFFVGFMVTIDKKNPIAMIYKTLHRKLTIKHHKPYEDWG